MILNSRTSIVSFNIDEESQEIVERLEKQNIVLAVREINEQKIVRASPHFFNTESEMMKVVEAIKNYRFSCSSITIIVKS